MVGVAEADGQALSGPERAVGVNRPGGREAARDRSGGLRGLRAYPELRPRGEVRLIVGRDGGRLGRGRTVEQGQQAVLRAESTVAMRRWRAASSGGRVDSARATAAPSMGAGSMGQPNGRGVRALSAALFSNCSISVMGSGCRTALTVGQACG
ncbi:hypothetical protein GCM10023083_42010 [Streptomyces phyllanthi]